MEREQILKLIQRKIDFNDMEKAKKILSKNYVISQGKMEAADVKIALNRGNPLAIRGHLIIAYEPLKKAFEDIDGNFFQIERPVEAVEIKEELEDNRHDFAIIGKMEWNAGIDEFGITIGNLKQGEIFLPKHPAIFNFLNPDEDTKKKKIQSVLNGVQINVYERENYVDNCLHEIGHLFYRTCTSFEEKMRFKEHFKYLKPSALFEYDWEKSSDEEVFCTIYKWYMKSVLLNQSFYNILEYEDREGLNLLQCVFDRIAKSRIIDDIWELSKDEVLEYLQPKFDKTTGKFIRRKDLFDKVKDIELPESVLNQIESVQNGIEYVGLGKALVPVKQGMIDFELLKMSKMEKATVQDKPTIYLDQDGCVTNFASAYETVFDRDVFADDSFTVTQFCLQQPRFFRTIPVLEKGKELYERLIKKYQVIFLTTAMDGMEYCRSDKVLWLKENICPEPTVIFSSNKADYANSAHDILIDDMNHNLNGFADAGGTAIDFRKHTNDEIMRIIAETLNPNEEIKKVKEQLKRMNVNTKPSEKQKEIGNYLKGDIIYKGLRIKIENPRGSLRFGIGENGRKWANRMKAHYGYIQHAGEAVDGDKVDVFIGDYYKNNKVFVINQGQNNMFDESKVMLGYQDINEAKKAYLQNYQKGWEKNILSIIPTNTKKLKEWLDTGDFKGPFRGDFK